MVFLLQLCCYQTPNQNTIVQAATNLQAMTDIRKAWIWTLETKRNPDIVCHSVLLLLAALLHRLALLEAMSPVYKEEMMLRMKSDLQGENWKIQLSSSNSEHHCLLHQLYIMCSNS